MAAYVLTDWPILQALTRAADRGVKVRIYLDGTQLAEREPAKSLRQLWIPRSAIVADLYISGCKEAHSQHASPRHPLKSSATMSLDKYT
jgi:phosphatidylserine/phosphatidylglycerophosphate/cardiolipin synthase-like enzyme